MLVNCLETHPPFSSLQQSHSNNIFSFAGLFRGISSLGRLCSESAKLLPFCGGYSQCSRYLLLLAGDVERNPGPISEGNLNCSADDRLVLLKISRYVYMFSVRTFTSFKLR